MENGLHKKYGLVTAICMVVGIVIGSGVFFQGADYSAENRRQHGFRHCGLAYRRRDYVMLHFRLRHNGYQV